LKNAEEKQNLKFQYWMFQAQIPGKWPGTGIFTEF
jgi:hypothetical protein